MGSAFSLVSGGCRVALVAMYLAYTWGSSPNWSLCVSIVFVVPTTMLACLSVIWGAKLARKLSIAQVEFNPIRGTRTLVLPPRERSSVVSQVGPAASRHDSVPLQNF